MTNAINNCKPVQNFRPDRLRKNSLNILFSFIIIAMNPNSSRMRTTSPTLVGLTFSPPQINYVKTMLQKCRVKIFIRFTVFAVGGFFYYYYQRDGK